LRQLADISSRAMGTSQNDAYTAVQAVHHVATVLSEAARRSFGVRRLSDRQGTVRVIIPVMGFPTHLRVACSHVRQGGLERHPRVRLELLRLLGSVAASCVGHRGTAAVEEELARVLADARRALAPGADLEEAEATATAVRQRLARVGSISVSVDPPR
jgi:uncharacterized membrane protein